MTLLVIQLAHGTIKQLGDVLTPSQLCLSDLRFGLQIRGPNAQPSKE
jgi:hypothetical protein